MYGYDLNIIREQLIGKNVDWKKMYIMLLTETDKAVGLIENGESGKAAELLIKAMLNCEEEYIETKNETYYY